MIHIISCSKFEIGIITLRSWKQFWTKHYSKWEVAYAVSTFISLPVFGQFSLILSCNLTCNTYQFCAKILLIICSCQKDNCWTELKWFSHKNCVLPFLNKLSNSFQIAYNDCYIKTSLLAHKNQHLTIANIRPNLLKFSLFKKSTNLLLYNF